MTTTAPETKVEQKLKPVVMYIHMGMHMPNNWKICFLLKELGLECEMKFLDFAKDEQKQSPHIDQNPNGRIPTLVDRNNNSFPVWESNAILMYLMDRYDGENKTGFLGTTSEEKAQVIQWLFFQASGQGMLHKNKPSSLIVQAVQIDNNYYIGPYYGQAHWFMFLHPEEIPSAIKRYQAEILRVLSVLEKHLQDRDW